MRPTSAAYRALLPHSHRIVSRVESWRSGTLLLGAVPHTAGAVTYDDTGTLKRRLALTVPARTPGLRLDPGNDPDAPLAAYGQRLHVSSGIVLPTGATELLTQGWFLITDWSRDEQDGTVSVTGDDLARLLVDDRLPTPLAPLAGSTFVSEATRLVGGILPVVFAPALADRAMSRTVVWETDRDKALTDLCDAWPARWGVDDDGAVRFDLPYGPVGATTVPDWSLTDGAAGTVVGRARHAQRGALFNRVAVNGKVPDAGGAAPYALAEVTDPGSPIRAGGPYGRVTRFFTSDMITTQAQANAVAADQLRQYATAGRQETVDAVPDPSLQLGDVGRVYTRDGDAWTGRTTGLTVPLTPEDAPMTVAVSVTPGEVPI